MSIDESNICWLHASHTVDRPSQRNDRKRPNSTHRLFHIALRPSMKPVPSPTRPVVLGISRPGHQCPSGLPYTRGPSIQPVAFLYQFPRAAGLICLLIARRPNTFHRAQLREGLDRRRPLHRRSLPLPSPTWCLTGCSHARYIRLRGAQARSGRIKASTQDSDVTSTFL